MFEVTVKVMGKSAQILEVEAGTTIAQAQELMGLEGSYTFNLGGRPATKDTVLTEGNYVVLAPSVKGAATAKKAVKPTAKVSKAAPKKTVVKTKKK